ncbi:MAG: hypothetical protein HC842_03325, partial [Cytophagales bacterium]|nr:hypothetical protein [Cytophagales bacterium]
TRRFHTLDLVWHTRHLRLGSHLLLDFTLSLQNLANRQNYYPNMRGFDPIQFQEQARSIWLRTSFHFH